MEQNFQTSFIPKKPMVEERAIPARSVGFFTVIPVFILFTVLLATGALYFYKGVLTKNVAEMQTTLNLARNRFEPARITELQVLDKRLRASTEILAGHIAVSPVFEALGAITMKTVRYTDFGYSVADETAVKDPKVPKEAKGSRVMIHLSGVATGYRAIALQSDLFATKEEGKHFLNPVFSNLTLNQSGNVVFDLEFGVDPAFVNYKTMLSLED